MDPVSESLIAAQNKAAALFAEVVDSGLIQALLGWEFGAPTAGHLIGHFPHERTPRDPKRFSIRHGNDVSLREPDDTGAMRHWILEIHFIDPVR
jgi:Xaa-Pro dipeptidase